MKEKHKKQFALIFVILLLVAIIAILLFKNSSARYTHETDWQHAFYTNGFYITSNLLGKESMMTIINDYDYSNINLKIKNHEGKYKITNYDVNYKLECQVEETFDMYENRFIYTLTDFMLSFIERIERMNKDLEYKKNNKFKYNGISNINSEKIVCDIELASNETIDLNNADDEIRKRIDIIKGSISAWKQSDLYKNLHKLRVPKVTHPIKRTNVILKNPNFQVAVKLWDYLYNYKVVESKLDKQPEVNEVLPPDLQKVADNSFLIYYLIMKYINSTSQAMREEYREYVKKAAMQMFGDSASLSLEKDSPTNSNQNLSNGTSQKYSEIKVRKEADSSVIENKIRHSIKDYLDKIEGSYFKLVGGGR